MAPCLHLQRPTSLRSRSRALPRAHPAGRALATSRSIDQRALPHSVVTTRIADADTAALAIRKMWVRGAPLIGAVGAYGLALALDRDASDAALAKAHATLDATRPTAVNLRWALDRVRAAVARLPERQRADAAWREADAIAAEDVAINHAIGVHGLALLRDIAARKDGPVQVMTHCNAGALATCGWGTATAPLFLAHAAGIPVHVWVSETRPRLQGAHLTAWELAARGVPHTMFVDSASGLLMRRGDVDIVLVGADRVAANGDVCNKIGTYDKALAAADNGVPFYVAVPSPTFDFALPSGDAIPIEARDADEVPERHRQRRARHDGDRARRSSRHARGQLRVRRHAGAARRRSAHRARHRTRHADGDRGDVSGAGAMSMPAADEQALRSAVVATALAMNARGINRGKSGNVSARCRTDGLRRLRRDADGIALRRDQAGGHRADARSTASPAARGCRRPNGAFIATSTARAAEVNAVVHTHAPFATTLACPFARHSRVPLHGRRRRRPRHSVRTVRDVRHAGAVRPRASPRWTDAKPACSPTTE